VIETRTHKAPELCGLQSRQLGPSIQVAGYSVSMSGHGRLRWMRAHEVEVGSHEQELD
jgi:hypothetical protein